MSSNFFVGAHTAIPIDMWKEVSVFQFPEGDHIIENIFQSFHPLDVCGTYISVCRVQTRVALTGL